MKTAEDIVKDKKAAIVSVSYDQSVQEACQLMVDKKIGAILVKKEANLCGNLDGTRPSAQYDGTTDLNPETAQIGITSYTAFRTTPPFTKSRRCFWDYLSGTCPSTKRGRPLE